MYQTISLSIDVQNEFIETLGFNLTQEYSVMISNLIVYENNRDNLSHGQRFVKLICDQQEILSIFTCLEELVMELSIFYICDSR